MSILRAIDYLSRPTPAVEWLMRAGEIAKRLNEESKRDGQMGNPFHQWVEGEQWRTIAGKPKYEISSIGRVRSWCSGEPRNLALSLSHDGYLFAVLRDERGKQRSHYVNRLVCEAWHGPAPSQSHQAAHLDGDKINNSPDNLVWATPAENNSHKVFHGTNIRGERVATAKLSEAQVRLIKKRLRRGESARQIADECGVGERAVRHISNGSTWAWLESEGSLREAGTAQQAPARDK